MIIADKNEVYALYKLLAKVKFSDQIDSYDLNEFANSPLITSLFTKAREEVTINLKVEGHVDFVEDWVQKSSFIFDSDTGKAIANRLKHLSVSSLQTISGWERKEVKNFAIELIDPLDFKQEEVEKLTDYIYQLAKDK